ncbi:hypothetical protein [Pontibacillus sp. HMF3514]|uniref:hypothetical protein n=1 Tax=Pontibacillus sp. HMF3514 TaxID=2692425 RepID=UPI001320096E|nr:hypothetical protein [Pontibacillus sp. HMF3514]QHE51866.1 hypothetical protein GS400_07380 [Pontibacillus sp. HMF3514]
MFLRIIYTVVDAFVDHFLEYHLLMDLFIISLVVLASFILAKLAYDMLLRQERRHLPPKRRAVIVSVLAVLFVVNFAYQYWDDHRKKSVEAVLSRYSEPEVVTLNLFSDGYISQLEQEEGIKELLHFLNQYKIQKVKSGGLGKVYSIEWKNDSFFLGPAAVLISIKENEISINEDYYKVLNGPVDMEWFQDFYKTYKPEEPS